MATVIPNKLAEIAQKNISEQLKAQNIVITQKLKLQEDHINKLAAQNAELHDALKQYTKSISLSDLQKYVVARCKQLNIPSGNVYKIGDATTLLNWLDGAVWRKEATNVQDELAD